MSDYNEEAYENALIELFQNMGWEHVYGPDIERDWHSPLYDSVLEDSIRRLNPKAAPAAIFHCDFPQVFSCFKEQ